jgi:rhodanese-related sulfurtransferase
MPHLRFGNLLAVVLTGTALLNLAQATPSVFQATLQEEDPVTPEISTEALQTMLADSSALVLDTRPHMEWAVSHIPGALNVAPKPGMSMSQYTSDVAEVGRLVAGDKSRAIVLYCNGPFCGKSGRVSEELLADGYTNVRRYQLGAPVWRALGGVMETELDGAKHIYDNDATAVFVDARPAELVALEPWEGTINIPLEEVEAAKDDLRLPMEDHNTRIVVFGESAAQARAVAEEVAANAFHNVSYFPGVFAELHASLSSNN